MRFAAPENFLLLVLVAIVGIFLFWSLARKKRMLARFGDLPLIMKTAPFVSFARQRTKIILILCGAALVAVALARLQFGTHMELLKRQGVDLVIALDVVAVHEPPR